MSDVTEMQRDDERDADGLTPDEQMVAALIWNRMREQYTAAALARGVMNGFEPRTMAQEIVATLAARPSTHAEALRRVLALADEFDAGVPWPHSWIGNRIREAAGVEK